MVLSESFWIFLVTTTAGIFLACMKVAYDSKCKTCDFGCIKIERDTGAEIEAEHNRMEHGITIPDNRESIDRPI